LSLGLGLGLGLVASGSAPARADTEGWLIGESRLPVYQRKNGDHRISARLVTDFRVAERSHGVQQALMRLGLTWDPTSWLMVASQTTFSAASNDGAKYLQELRQKLEATLTVPLGSLFFISHRQRFELRRVPGRTWARQRVLNRLNFAPEGWLVHPHIWNELFYDSRDGISQHRLVAGLAWVVRRNLRIEAGYLWRLRLIPPSTWEQDHGLRIAFSWVPSYEGEVRYDGGCE
jgi:hypothetical protein